MLAYPDVSEPYLSEHTFVSDLARAATLCRGDDEHLLRIWGWLDNGADVDEAGGDAWDGEELCVLSRCEHPYLAKFLLERGADVNRADRYGATPLYHACSNPNEPWGTEIMNALLDAGADVDAKTTVGLQRVAIAGETALSTSLDFFRRERVHRKLGLSYVSLLLRRGASLDDCWGGMPVEECLRHIETPDAFGDDINEIYDPRGDASDASDVASRATDKYFIACKKMIADERRRRYLLPRKEILRLRTLVARHRATSKLKRSLPSTVASRDETDRKFDRKFDCKTNAGIRDALAQTAQTAPAPSGFIIPPPRQSYSQRPLSTTSVAAMRHIEWLMAKDTPNELVWRVLEYWNVRT